MNISHLTVTSVMRGSSIRRPVLGRSGSTGWSTPREPKRLPDPSNTVLLVGYQAEGTKGRALQDGAKFIRLFGQQVPVRAQVVSMGQLSAHAGKSDLLRWLSGFTAAPRQTFLVHGEPVALNSLRDAVTEQFKWPVTIPAYLQTFDLNPV